MCVVWLCLYLFCFVSVPFCSVLMNVLYALPIDAFALPLGKDGKSLATHTAGRRPIIFVSWVYDAMSLSLRGCGCLVCAAVGRGQSSHASPQHVCFPALNPARP